MCKKPFSINVKEFGRGKPTVERFATLAEASKYVQSQWQGADYVEGNAGFHSDSCTFGLIGFTIKDIGQFYFTDDDCREYRFNPTDLPDDALDFGDSLEAGMPEH